MSGGGLFPLALGLAVALAMTALTVWAVGDVARLETAAGRRGGWQLALLLALASPLVMEGNMVGVRQETRHYAGPDLLSESEVEVSELTSRWWVPGITRTRELRRTQEGRLLSESRVHEVGVPLLLLIVWAGWSVRRRALLRRRTASSSDVRGSDVPALGVMAVLACTSGAAGCAPAEDRGPGLAETRLLELLDTRTTGDVTGFEDVAHPLILYDDLPNGSLYRGIQEVAGFLQRDRQWATGLFLDVQEVRSGGDWAAVEWALEGSQAAPIPGVADSASFRRFQLRGVTLIELEGELIIRAVDYADMVPLFLDLGGVLRLPNGDSLVGASGAGTGAR